MQEDEIQLLKSALADVVRRLNVSEEQQAMGARRGPTKGNIQSSTKPRGLLLYTQTGLHTWFFRTLGSVFPL